MDKPQVSPKGPSKKKDGLQKRIDELEQRCADADEALGAIRRGEVDALVIETEGGEKIFTFQGAETTYRLMVERFNEGAATLIDDGTILYCNQRFAEMLKVPLEVVIGTSFLDFLPNEQRPAFSIMLARGLKENCREEYKLIRRDGFPVPVMISLSNFSSAGSPGVCLIATDLTMRKIAEEMTALVQEKTLIEEELRGTQSELEKSNQKLKAEIAERIQAQEELSVTQNILQTIVDRMPAAVALIRGSDLRIQLVNPAYQALGPGLKMVDRTFDEVWPDTGQNLTAICRKVLETGIPHQAEDELNIIRRTPDGPLEQAYFSWSLYRVQLPGEQGWGLLNNAWETTTRKQTENALNETQRKYQDIVETTSEFIWEIDGQGRYTYCSPQMETMWGLKPTEMLGKTPFDVMPPEDAEKNLKYFIEAAQNHLPFKDLETVAINGKGERIYIETSGVPFFNPNGELKGYRGITRDVTVRKKAEDLLHKAYDELEQRVFERTQELVHANNKLIGEIAERERAEQEAWSSAQLAEGLAQSVIAVNSSLNFEQVLDTILEQVQRSIPCTMIAIMQLEIETLRIIRLRGSDRYPEVVEILKSRYSLDDAPFLSGIIKTEKPACYSDKAGSKLWEPTPEIKWLHSFIAAPLIFEGHVAGLILLGSDRSDAFSEETISLLMKFVPPAALAIQNARLYAAESHARLFAETMSAMNLALTQTLDLDTVLKTLLEYLPHLISYTGAHICILENEDQLVIRALSGYSTNRNSKYVVGSKYSANEFPYMRKVLTTQKSMLISDTQEHSGWKPFIAKGGIHSWLGIPIMLHGQAMGVIGMVHEKPGQFTKEHLQLIESVAAQVSVAIQNAWLFEQVRTGSERLQFLSHRLVEVQENKLLYIAQELHDEVGQALTSLMLSLKMLEKEASKSTRIKAAVDEMGQVLEGTMENLHRLAIDLRPAVLDQMGLEVALHQLVRSASKRYNVDVHFEMVGVKERLLSKVEIALYRIVQEALNNVARHAKAKHADVLLQIRGEYLILIVEDDGIGFDPLTAAQSDRLGIFGMRERAEMLGGKLTLESRMGKGTTVLVEVPLNHPNNYA